jgi:hypothetical protein
VSGVCVTRRVDRPWKPRARVLVMARPVANRRLGCDEKVRDDPGEAAGGDSERPKAGASVDLARKLWTGLCVMGTAGVLWRIVVRDLLRAACATPWSPELISLPEARLANPTTITDATKWQPILRQRTIRTERSSLVAVGTRGD